MRILFLFIILFSLNTHARVFNINESSIATYFKGSFGNSNIGKDPYEKSSGAQTVFSESVDYNFGGEIGFMFPSKFYSIRIGMEVIAPHSPSGLKGNNASGTQLMRLDSNVYGIFPVAHLEYYIAKNAFGRVYLSLGGGYGKVTMSNDYTFTTDGDTTYNPLTSFSERASQYTYLVETAIGYEMAFVQAVTFSIDFGYRYSAARSLKYSDAVTNFNGSQSDGSPVLNSDGKHKSLDLGGVFTGLSFRFYFN